MNSLNLGWIHLQTFFRKNEAQVLDSVFGKMTFVQTGIETIFTETAEILVDMFLMICRAVRIDEDVI